MTISGNYAHPVYVNGYQCNNCTDVENAKRHIDPAHPKSGPFNINADTDPTRHHDPSVKFGGALNALNASTARAASGPSNMKTGMIGRAFDLSV